MKYQAEPFSRWMREALEGGLFEAHWREVGAFIEEIPLEVDFEKFLALERAQVLACFTARDDAGKLAGYAIMICAPSLNHKESVFAQSQAIYISPEHRGHGAQLLWLVERELRGRGVDVFVFMTKPGRMTQLLEATGYRPIETAMAKLLSYEAQVGAGDSQA